MEQVAKTIGADLDTINDWLEVGAIGRAVFGGGQFSRYELDRAALVFELVKFGLSPSCAREIVREMEYDLQQVWTRIPSYFKAYALVTPTRRKWLVSWCWMKSSEQIDLLPLKDHIVLSVSDTLARITNETNQRGHPKRHINLPPKDPNDDDEDEEDDQDEPKEEEPAVVREPDEC